METSFDHWHPHMKRTPIDNETSRNPGVRAIKRTTDVATRIGAKYTYIVGSNTGGMVDVVFLGINDIGERIYEWLTSREDTAVLALLTEKEQLSIVETLEPDLVVAGGFRHIVPEEVLEMPPLGAVNLHKSYLPYNRGANPNVWSILEGAPAGVSIHYMTSDVDGGPIIDRRRVTVEPDDDARDLYERLEDAQFEQFRDVWPSIRDGTTDTIEQGDDEGTYHLKRDFTALWELDLDRRVRVEDIIDRLRALTFEPYRNAYFEKDGTRYYVTIDIRREDAPVESGVKAKNVPEYLEDEF